MNKKKLIYLTLTAIMLLTITPTVNAWTPFSTDEQLKQNAVDILTAEHPELDGGVFTAVITSSWEFQWCPFIPWHKHVTIDVTYGYQSTGSVHWEGRSYNVGGTYTLVYTQTEPTTPMPQPTVKIGSHGIYLNFAPSVHYWNGVMWKNEPRASFFLNRLPDGVEVQITIMNNATVIRQVSTHTRGFRGVIVVQIPVEWLSYSISATINGVTYSPDILPTV